MKTRCPICRTKIEFGDKYCDNCYKNKILKNKETRSKNMKKADDSLKTPQWKALRNKVIKRDNNCCRLCLINDYVETRTLQVHHIHKRIDRPDLTFNEDNLVTLCKVCHEKVEKLSVTEQKKLLRIGEIEEIDFRL